MSANTPILVTGATGKVGRQVVSRLTRAGTSVRALARNPTGFEKDVEPAVGDLTDVDSVRAALDGVESVFLVWPFFGADAVEAFLDAAGKHVRRIVFLSAFAHDPVAGPATFHGDVERLIEKSGLDWTFLRAGGFASNTLMWADQIRGGVVRWPYGNAARSLIHEADIAEVGVLALTRDGHIGAKYNLTGPDTMTQIEQVAAIGNAVGREVRWEELARPEARAQLAEAWGESSFVDGALDHWASLEREPEEVTRTVQEVTGAPARTFRQWAADHADEFR
jgi:uncharacterized protein YbjT (DUF2867 family)